MQSHSYVIHKSPAVTDGLPWDTVWLLIEREAAATVRTLVKGCLSCLCNSPL